MIYRKTTDWLENLFSLEDIENIYTVTDIPNPNYFTARRSDLEIDFYFQRIIKHFLENRNVLYDNIVSESQVYGEYRSFEKYDIYRQKYPTLFFIDFMPVYLERMAPSYSHVRMCWREFSNYVYSSYMLYYGIKNIDRIGYTEDTVNPPEEGFIGIGDIDDLQKIGNHIDYPLDGNYMLTNNIDASETREWNGGKGFNPVGSNPNPFTGTFDGRGYSITSLYINRPQSNEYDVGLFGYNSGNISNVRIVGCDITGYYNVGALVGYSFGGSEISACLSTGEINSAYQYAGGLIGTCVDSNVNYCYSECNVTAIHNYSGGLIGLFAKSGEDDIIVSNCFATGDVSGLTNVGGLIGKIEYGTVFNCYSVGLITGSSLTGGLIGVSNNSTINNSYYNTETSGQSDINKGISKTTEQLFLRKTYSLEWDFFFTWTLNIDDYPTLQVFPEQEPTFLYRESSIETTDYRFTRTQNLLEKCGFTGDNALSEDQLKTLIENGAHYIGYNDYEDPLFISSEYRRNIFKTFCELAIKRKTSSLPQQEEPYEIIEIRDIPTLLSLAGMYDPEGIDRDITFNGHYVLMADLDFSEYEYNYEDQEEDDLPEWRPLGSPEESGGIGKPFRGIFDGNKHTIKGIKNRNDRTMFSLFWKNYGIIKDLKIEDFDSDSDDSSGICISNYGLIEQCGVEDSTFIGTRVGGISIENFGTIQRCYTKNSTLTGTYTGGIVTFSKSENNLTTSDIIDCYIYNNNLSISNTGLVSRIPRDNGGDIINCYNFSTEQTGTNKGGIVSNRLGYGIIENCYYLDAINPDEESGHSLTEEEMSSISNYNNWDFVNTWMFSEEVEDEGKPPILKFELDWGT